MKNKKVWTTTMAFECVKQIHGIKKEVELYENGAIEKDLFTKNVVNIIKRGY